MRLTVVEPDGTRRQPPTKGAFIAPAGSEIWFEVPGSGGYGEPAERDPEKIRADLRDGYVTAAAAKRDYGFDD
jgi:N-methylhydantoinase B